MFGECFWKHFFDFYYVSNSYTLMARLLVWLLESYLTLSLLFLPPDWADTTDGGCLRGLP